MTTPRLPRRKRIEPPATFRERRWLLTGRPAALWFIERERVTALWRAYGNIIVRRQVRYFPFSRPPNWWRLDAPEWLPDGETERTYLERHPDLLLSAERARLRRMARKAGAQCSAERVVLS